MIKAEILDRKGAKKVQDIPKDVLELLNKGEIATVNLTEWLAVDQKELIEHTFPAIALTKALERINPHLTKLKNNSAMNSIKVIGKELFEYCFEHGSVEPTFTKLISHKADILRCYASYLLALNEDLDIEAKLKRSQELVSDSHFGVREVIWMALRPEVEKHLSIAIRILSKWTQSEDENIRRFTTEVTRPRGVWCKHLDSLKEKPEQALSILAPLMSDSSKYVRDSVGNWLNDASKSSPDFVKEFCNTWEKKSATKETLYILKRAKRTLEKKETL
ncbi:DNA alkylation repair protein [Rapidithrix thailandica]|uniref:DNA alkylation repair protein n=1 Tax=Rapidithrix thailandica TaxID=413964 RepID=A0AAW9RYC5_9BACT